MEDDIYETVTKGTLIRGTLNSVIPTDGALVNRIGYTAFRYSGIQSIVIPSNITILESYCFNYAESLTSVILHEGLTTIGSQAFSKCTALTSIIIPASVIDMRSNVFANSLKLTHIYCRIAQEPTSGWDGSWNYKISGDPNQGYIPVTWGYTGA
ncbi:MAG: leucine-rich repeat domain-containing protein [Clostridia bacterium]